jgi:hypothetical protein
VRYEYLVFSKAYFGSSSTGSRGLPAFDQIRLGDQVSVTYLPENPSVSIAGDAKEANASWSMALFGVLPIFCMFAGGIAALRLHRKQSLK